MRGLCLRGPVLLLIWQIAPVGVERDSTGRVQVTFGFGGGQFEERSLNCSGDVVDSWSVGFRTAGAQLDAWPDRRFRLSAFGGLYMEEDRDGPHGGFQVAAEGQKVGLGLGAAHSPFRELGGAVPSGYLRFGNIDRPHFRAEVFPPNPMLGAGGDVFRLGVGFNKGQLHGANGFLGVSAGPYADQAYLAGIFGEVYQPVGRRLDLGVTGSVRPAAGHLDGGLGVALRYHFKR